MKPTLLILAAGMGSRYGGLKQLDQLGPHGETIMDYSVNDAIKAGFGKVVFVIRKHFEEDFKRFVLSKYEGKIALEYVCQELDMLPAGVAFNPERVKPYGTSHAMWVAREVIHEPFVVINADDFYGSAAFKTIADYLVGIEDLNSTSYAMVGYQLNKTLSDFGTVSRGICVTNENDELTGITEMTKIRRYEDGIKNISDDGVVTMLHEDDPVSMNFWGFTPTIFDTIEKMFIEFMEKNHDNIKSEFVIPLVVNTMIVNHKATLKVLKSDAEWFGVTYQEDRPYVVEKLKALNY